MKILHTVSLKGYRKEIINVLRNALVDFLVARTSERTSNDVIHVSDLYGFCPRRWWLAKKYNLNPRVSRHSNSPAVQLTYMLGEKIEDIVKEALSKSDLNLIWTYVCNNCGEKRTTDFIEKCRLCGWTDFEKKQVELRMKVGDFKLIGHPDFILTSSQHRELFILECKSIGFSKNPTYNFDELKSPLVMHIYQVIGYLILLSQMKSTIRLFGRTKFIPSGYIIYVSKLHRISPFKIFEVKRKKYVVEEIHKNLRTLIKAKDEPPPRRCSRKLCFFNKTFCPQPIIERCWL